MKIDLPLFDLSTDRMKQPLHHWLELGEKFYTYHISCYVESQPNESEGEYIAIEKYINYTGTFFKSQIQGVDIDFSVSANGDDRYDVWVVEIMKPSGDTDIRIKCETESSARELFTQILIWIANDLH